MCYRRNCLSKPTISISSRGLFSVDAAIPIIARCVNSIAERNARCTYSWSIGIHKYAHTDRADRLRGARNGEKSGASVLNVCATLSSGHPMIMNQCRRAYDDAFSLLYICVPLERASKSSHASFRVSLPLVCAADFRERR